MIVIKPNEKDLFDFIIDEINENENDRVCLLLLLMQYKDSPSINSLCEFIKTAMDNIYYEVSLYNKMLRYLKLLKSNDKYDSFSNSANNDLFKEIIEVLVDNHYQRALASMANMVAVENATIEGATGYGVCSLHGSLDYILDEVIFEDIEKMIPKK